MDCKKELNHLASDTESLAIIKKAHKEDKMKFPSSCLDTVLRKNFSQSADYLLAEYYPSTNIDTEVIVKKVAEDTIRQ